MEFQEFRLVETPAARRLGAAVRFATRGAIGEGADTVRPFPLSGNANLPIGSSNQANLRRPIP
jgi:hypothetical protein